MNKEGNIVSELATDDPFRFADDLGPEKIVQIHEIGTGLKAVVVIDNVAAGPSIGGIRMAPDVSIEECFRLARAMTLKNAAAGLRHGGGKSVIFGDPRMDPGEKERLIRAFACAIRDLTDYIAGPDMGTDETCMGWIQDEIGRSVGLPPEIGGIPLDEIGATGFGVAIAIEEATNFCDVRLEGARVAIQGFGSVGKHAARFLAERGAVLVAAADSGGTVHDQSGLDVDELMALKAARKGVTDYGRGEKLGRDAVIGIDCDILIPAARPDVLHADNAGELKARMVVQGANIAVTMAAERILYQRNILSVPDFIANAGGVICGAVEYAGGSRSTALQTIEEKVRENTREILTAAADEGVLPREAAVAMAERRIHAAMKLRRWT